MSGYCTDRRLLSTVFETSRTTDGIIPTTTLRLSIFFAESLNSPTCVDVLLSLSACLSTDAPVRFNSDDWGLGAHWWSQVGSYCIQKFKLDDCIHLDSDLSIVTMYSDCDGAYGVCCGIMSSRASFADAVTWTNASESLDATRVLSSEAGDVNDRRLDPLPLFLSAYFIHLETNLMV